MRSVTCSMGASRDGCILGPDGGFDRTAPDEEVFRFVTDEIRGVGFHLLRRRLYVTMLYGETIDRDPSLGDSMLEQAALRKALPNVVFSTRRWRSGAVPAWPPAVRWRRSNGCVPSRGTATWRSAARRSPPKWRRRV